MEVVCGFLIYVKKSHLFCTFSLFYLLYIQYYVKFVVLNIKLIIIMIKPKYLKCEIEQSICKLERVRNRKGVPFFVVTVDVGGRPLHLFFERLESAFDFVNSTILD